MLYSHTITSKEIKSGPDIELVEALAQGSKVGLESEYTIDNNQVYFSSQFPERPLGCEVVT